MKKIIAIIILVLILLTPLWSWLAWYLSPAEKLNVLVINKSDDNEEHRSFNWILSQEKYYNQLLKEYNYKEDFLGDNIALGNLHDKDADSIADYLQVAYLVESGSDSQDDITSSSLINNETNAVYRILENLYKKRKLIFAEVNTISTATSLQTQDNLEDLFAVDFSGWKLKYFSSLKAGAGNSIPEWVIESYEDQYDKDFEFESKSGIILLHRNGNVLVLEEGVHLELAVPVINTSSLYQAKYDLPAFTEFTGWIEINSARNEDDVVSSFKLHTNASGDSLLDKFNIPKKFPALIGDKDQNLRFYFCGDFADNPVQDELSHFKGIRWISGLFHGNDANDERKFFWEYYVPLMTNILEDYTSKLNTATQDRELPVYQDRTDTDTSINHNTSVESLQENTNEDKREDSYRVGGNMPESKLQAIGNNINKDPSNAVSGKWYIIIGSLQTQEKAQRFINRKGYSSLEIIFMPELNTYRVSYGSYDNLLEAQNAFNEIINDEPNAWIVQL